jgi:uncharacterized protein YjlB
MKRSSLEVGGLYVGPGNKCYEIVDMSPGWRIDATGSWVNDPVTRTRHMPGKGNVPYRTNLAIKAYLHEQGDDGTTRREAVVDPRKLVGTWNDYQQEQKTSNKQRKEAESVINAARRVLRTQPGFKPSQASAYQTSQDGSFVTIPTGDLAVLAGVHRVTTTEPKGTTEVIWSNP